MRADQSGRTAEGAEIVAALKPLVEGDGARLELVALVPQEHSVSLRLVLDGVECLDCVMPRDYLEQLALKLLRSSRAGVQRVVIDDPREHVGSAA
jgi:hypothetical protein